MKLSIITPTYNSEQFLKDNLNSVQNQYYNNIEHIFIDNNSTDKTLDILKTYKKKSNFNVIIDSSKDKGIYYAFNKGLKLASGDVVTIINSDDFINGNNVINEIMTKFKNEELDFLYGNVKIVSRKNLKKIIRIWVSTRIQNKDFYKVPHPSFFVKKNFIKKNKINFNTLFYIASDLDFIIKCFKKSKKFLYLDKILIHQRSGGASQKFLNIFKANFETYKILKKHKFHFKLIFIIRKIIFKICQIKFN
tara:strand:- start:178 stop:924 length:747 start_codon:yes stop_codon:yes gene_type:complete